jgi:sigma-E factor negative regulatory protein RseB
MSAGKVSGHATASWLLLTLLTALSAQVRADDSPRQWLDDMSSALETLNYDGTFVYLHNNRLETMRIIHRVDKGGVRERLVSLTGSAREVLRDDKAVTCIMTDNKSVMVGHSRPRRHFHVVPRDLDRLNANYTFEDAGKDRMAGYPARVIAIRPRDTLRYGYRFWIDRDSHMLLKSDLTGVDGKPIEQVMFTALKIGADIPPGDLQPSLNGDGYSWHSQMNDTHRPDPQRDAHPDWHVMHLPPGFTLSSSQHGRMHDAQAETEHMVFSDGLATVSVYIEDADSVHHPLLGHSGMGAMNAYGARVDGHQITVVGEVPEATVKMIARSVQRTDPKDD